MVDVKNSCNGRTFIPFLQKLTNLKLTLKIHNGGKQKKVYSEEKHICKWSRGASNLNRPSYESNVKMYTFKTKMILLEAGEGS